MNSGNEFRLDRTVFAGMTFQEADAANDYKNKTPKERLEIAAYLNSVAYNYPINNPPKMDRTIFEARSIHHG